MAGGRKAKSENEMQFNVEIGKKIAALRRRRGMTQSALADAVGISRQRLYWYEAGRSPLPAYLIERLAAMLYVSCAELVIV